MYCGFHKLLLVYTCLVLFFPQKIKQGELDTLKV